jgi:FkbM family methyltransferase
MIIFCPPNESMLVVHDEAEKQMYLRGGGGPEKAVVDWVRATFIDRERCFVDAGAHCGGYALNLARDSAHVHAFEAQRRTFNRLSAGIALNDLYERVTAHHVALGDKNGECELQIITVDGTANSLLTSLPYGQNPLAKERVVQRTLDSFELTNVGFLKLDVEGYEVNLLRGATRTLESSDWPPFLFESWGWDSELRRTLFEFVEFLGYRIVPMVQSLEAFIAERVAQSPILPPAGPVGA